MPTILRPGPDEVPPYYVKYVELAGSTDLEQALRTTSAKTAEVLARIAADKEDFRYAEGKWSIKDVFQHMIDSERIFAYRALRFARNDDTPLPGFEENDYADAVDTSSRSLKEIAQELEDVRKATIGLFKSFTPEMAARIGVANDVPISVRAIGWTIAGHTLHHLSVIEQRYL